MKDFEPQLALRRIRTPLLWATTVVFLVLIVCNISSAPQNSRNDERLAVVASWIRGFPFYTPINSGVLVGNYYPPLGTLPFLPTVFVNHPVPAILLGSALSFLMNMSPIIGALFMWGRGRPDLVRNMILGSVLYLGLLLLTDGPSVQLFFIHVDAPAITLMLWGVIFFAEYWTSRSARSLALSAFFLGSVVWAKQLGVSLPIVFLITTYLLAGPRPAIVFAAWSAATLMFWFVVLTPVIADWRAFYFDIISVHASHPWVGEVTGGVIERLSTYVSYGRSFLRHYWLLYLLLLSIALGLQIFSDEIVDKRLRFSFAVAATALIAGIAMIPFTLLGVVKEGGNVNSEAYAVQPALFGLVIGGVGYLEIANKSGSPWKFAADSIVCATLLGFILTLLPSRKILSSPLRLHTAPVITAYNESKKGNVWFPEFPLATLLATGKLYHHSYSVYAIFLGGHKVSDRQLADGLPKAPFTLKYLADDLAGRIMPYLGISETSPHEQVGPWIVYEVPVGALRE